MPIPIFCKHIQMYVYIIINYSEFKFYGEKVFISKCACHAVISVESNMHFMNDESNSQLII